MVQEGLEEPEDMVSVKPFLELVEFWICEQSAIRLSLELLGDAL